MSIHIRVAVKRDLDQILAMECLEERRWNRERYNTELQKRNVFGLVAEYDGQINGIIVYKQLGRRIEVLRLLVDRDCRRRRLGAALFYKLADKLMPERRTRLVFTSSEYETGGHLFLRDMGCICTSVERGACDDGSDAYKFEFTIKSGVEA